MADNRKTWSYVDENGTTHFDEPVSIQNREWANDAVATDVRDPDSSVISQPRTDGWKGETPKGDEFNYVIRRKSLMLSELEGKGILSWSAVTNYKVPAMVWASDNFIYISLAASGPAEPSGVRDPIDQPGFWRRFNVLPLGFKKGFVINQNVSLPTVKIDFSLGAANVSAGGGTYDIFKGQSITKIINQAFVPGDDAGGLFSGAVLPPFNPIYAFIIVRDDGLVEAGFDDDPNAIHLPAGYFAFFRAGSVWLDGSLNIIPFIAEEREGGAVEYFPNVMITQILTGTLPGGRQLLTLPIAPGINPIAKITVVLAAVAETALHITPTFQTVRTGAEQNAVLRVTAASVNSVSTFDISVDDISQIAWEISINAAVVFLHFTTRSWVDKRISI